MKALQEKGDSSSEQESRQRSMKAAAAEADDSDDVAESILPRQIPLVISERMNYAPLSVRPASDVGHRTEELKNGTSEDECVEEGLCNRIN